MIGKIQKHNEREGGSCITALAFFLMVPSLHIADRTTEQQKKTKKNPTKTKQNQTIVGLFFCVQKNKPTNF